MRTSLARLTLLVLSATWLTAPAWATDRALLIGVSDYPALPKRLWLNGPINDVALMRKTLAIRGFDAANVDTLVSRAGTSQEPTRAHILQAMARTLQAAQAGDRVVFYLAGHGSQQPQRATAQTAQRPAEPDGLDEVFLPADVGIWDGKGSQAAIPNALLDDEIGEWMDALVDKGAQVWGIFDTCHAAGMARGRGFRWRAVASSELGVRLPAGLKATSAQRGYVRTDGRTLAYAARTHELAGEEWLPRGKGDGGVPRIHGVFTYHLSRLWIDLQSADSQNFEAALQRRYREENRTAPTPVFQGRGERVWP